MFNPYHFIVVQLFNTVSEFQVSQHKEALQAQKDQKAKTAAIIQAVGTDKAHQTLTTSNERIIQQIQSRQSKWKVLEDESEDEEGNIKIEEF
jgi:tRNA 2-selenouridine synthase SelU